MAVLTPASLRFRIAQHYALCVGNNIYPMRSVRLWERGDHQGEGEDIGAIPTHEPGGITLSITRWIMSEKCWSEVHRSLETNRFWLGTNDVITARQVGLDSESGVGVTFFRYEGTKVIGRKTVKLRVLTDSSDGTASQELIRMFYGSIPSDEERLPRGVVVADWRYFNERGDIVRSKHALGQLRDK